MAQETTRINKSIDFLSDQLEGGVVLNLKEPCWQITSLMLMAEVMSHFGG